MNHFCLLLAAGALFALCLAAADADGTPRARRLGTLADEAEVFAVPSEGQSWAAEIRSKGLASLHLDAPARIDVTDDAHQTVHYSSGYQSVTETGDGFLGRATIAAGHEASFHFEDRWTLRGPVLELDRTVQVTGSVSGKFVSVLSLETADTVAGKDVRRFIPSAVYGTPVGDALEIREDNMTAPLVGLYFGDGSSMALLARKPQAGTADAPLAGIMGVREAAGGGVEVDARFPGVGEGTTQHTHLAIRVDRHESFHAFSRNAWRWSWQTLDPPVYHQDIEVIRRSLVDMLAEQVETVDGRTGLPNAITWTLPPTPPPSDWRTTLTRSRNAIMGFTGKNLESAVMLLMDAARGRSPLDAEHRRKALAIIDSFLTLKLDPPVGEGFDLDTGAPEQAIPLDRGFPHQVYLRSFGDDLKILLLGYEFEMRHGRAHPGWLHWCRGFADWLMTQQQPDGGFPRSWVPATGEVRVAAPQSSYNAVPLLVFLTRITGDTKYLEAAEHTAEFCWDAYQAGDQFVGGTIDNPNVQDKEAATLSTEAYLALYEQTHERKWLDRAEAAADNAETYIYIWEAVAGVPSVGKNKIVASLHGGSDMYMAFDVDEYAKLFHYTGDRHYYDVARLLLHDTKVMVGIPGRTFDYPGPGWQTEGAEYPVPGRAGSGPGVNLWLPWVSTEHLHGIAFTEQFDPELFERLSGQ